MRLIAINRLTALIKTHNNQPISDDTRNLQIL